MMKWPRRRPAAATPDDTGWFKVAGHGHLFLKDPHAGSSRPVCGASAPEPPLPAWERGVTPICDGCDDYLHNVYLPQIS